MCTRCVCVDSGVAGATGLPGLIGEERGGADRPTTEWTKKHKEIKIQIAHAKGFDFPNTAES